MPAAEANGRRSTMKLALARSIPAARTRLELCTNAASAWSGDWAAVWAKIRLTACFVAEHIALSRSVLFVLKEILTALFFGT